MSKTAFITGATSGIGKATAIELAKENMNLILCGRRKQRLDELKNELSSIVKVYTLSFDIRNRDEVKQAIASLP